MYSDLYTRCINIASSIVFLKLHLFQSSTCQLKAPEVTTPLTYQMKNHNPWVLTIQFAPFEITTDGCIYDKIHYSFLTHGGGSLPAFMKGEEANLVLTVSTFKLSFWGYYVIDYSASFNPYLINYTSIEINVLPYPNTAAPKFTGTLMNPFTVYVGSQQAFQLPSTTDPDDDPYSVEVTYPEGTVPAFIEYDEVKRTFSISPKEKDVGSYTFVINMTDSHPLKCRTNIVNFVIEVLLFSPAEY